MDKYMDIVSFGEEYKELSETKRDVFSNVVNRLINENFIYFYLDKDKDDYYFITSNREIIRKYLSIIDYDLMFDDNYRIYFLKSNSSRNKIIFKKLDSIILLLLRRLYAKNNSDISSDTNIKTNLKELIDNVGETGIYNEIPKQTHFEQALKLLKRYKIINFEKLDEDSNIIIYPTILKVIDINDIHMMNEKIKSYKLSKEEEVDED